MSNGFIWRRFAVLETILKTIPLCVEHAEGEQPQNPRYANITDKTRHSTKTRQDKTTLREGKATLRQDKTALRQDKTTARQDNTKTRRGKTTRREGKGKTRQHEDKCVSLCHGMTETSPKSNETSVMYLRALYTDNDCFVSTFF